MQNRLLSFKHKRFTSTPPEILFANMWEEKKTGDNNKEAPTKKMRIKLDQMDEAADNEMEICTFLFKKGDAKDWIK